MNTVNWSLELNESNIDKIEKVNQILIPGYSSTSTTETKAPTKSSSTKSSSKKSGPTFDDVKAAAKEAQKEHGKEFLLECVDDAGGDDSLTPMKAVSSVDEGMWSEFIDALNAGPEASEEESDDDDLDSDFDDLDDDEPEEVKSVSVETVKKTIKAYKDENGVDDLKKILKKHKALPISEVDSLSAAARLKLFNELS